MACQIGYASVAASLRTCTGHVKWPFTPTVSFLQLIDKWASHISFLLLPPAITSPSSRKNPSWQKNLWPWAPVTCMSRVVRRSPCGDRWPWTPPTCLGPHGGAPPRRPAGPHDSELDACAKSGLTMESYRVCPFFLSSTGGGDFPHLKFYLYGSNGVNVQRLYGSLGQRPLHLQESLRLRETEKRMG